MPRRRPTAARRHARHGLTGAPRSAGERHKIVMVGARRSSGGGFGRFQTLQLGVENGAHALHDRRVCLAAVLERACFDRVRLRQHDQLKHLDCGAVPSAHRHSSLIGLPLTQACELIECARPSWCRSTAYTSWVNTAARARHIPMRGGGKRVNGSSTSAPCTGTSWRRMAYTLCNLHGLRVEDKCVIWS